MNDISGEIKCRLCRISWTYSWIFSWPNSI